MLVRIVKMEFKPEHINTFQNLFEEVKEQIRDFEGCQFLELYQVLEQDATFFTYSYWKNTTALENYRQSSLFKTTWTKTKVLFQNKPQAWSVEKIVSLP